jgi:hypothetical protein
MEYEGSIGLVSRKMIFFIADFHVLGLFMAKKLDLSEKKNLRLSRAVVRRNLSRRYRSHLKS